MLPILLKANISRPSNFLLLEEHEWKVVCVEIKKDYFFLTVQQFDEIILNGIKGKYNEKQFSINAFTIFKWLEAGSYAIINRLKATGEWNKLLHEANPVKVVDAMSLNF